MLPPALLPVEKIPVVEAKNDYNRLLSPESELSPVMQLKVNTTESEQNAFEKELFGDCAVLCEAWVPFCRTNPTN